MVESVQSHLNVRERAPRGNTAFGHVVSKLLVTMNFILSYKACDGDGGGWTLVMGAPWKPSVPKSEVMWHTGTLSMFSESDHRSLKLHFQSKGTSLE